MNLECEVIFVKHSKMGGLPIIFVICKSAKLWFLRCDNLRICADQDHFLYMRICGLWNQFLFADLQLQQIRTSKLWIAWFIKVKIHILNQVLNNTLIFNN
jgi:hypothetical protein